MLRHLELIVDKWPIGPGNQMHTLGQRFFIDPEAARILTGFGKAVYVDKVEVPEANYSATYRVAVGDGPAPRKKRKYNRRDMRPTD